MTLILMDCPTSRPALDILDRSSFAASLRRAERAREAQQGRLDRLSTERLVTIYTYGAKGADLASQLRLANVDCVIFDNAASARERATKDGFDVAPVLPAGRPIVVAAGQNQVEILDSLNWTAYSLAEALYAFDLRHAYGRMREFVQAMSNQTGELFARYQSLAPAFRADFFAVLLYRASLDVRHTNGTRLPVDRMWAPEAADLTSFCDVGAYDGDTLRSVSTILPHLSRSFTVEPNPEQAPAIAAAATARNLQNVHYTGAAWSRRARLKATILPDGMFVIREAPDGELQAESLDVLAAGETYDYIKFDVEGTEKEALQGATNLLKRARCIAIAAYHLPNDLLDLPNQVDSILGAGHAWHWGFRHYSQCFDDSIFYAYR
jgi:FkbM family methyltransferase